MATHKSAIKRHRQSLERRLRNRRHRSRLRGRVKAIRKAIAAGDVETAREMLPATLALVDHTAKLGVIHDNAAARTKSRISRAIQRAATAS
jgi:small subunit ribosomal protein S20